MDQPPKLRIRNPKLVNLQSDSLKPKTTVKKFLDNEDFVLGIVIGIVGLIALELFILMIYGLFGAIFSSL
jgi:hypothetical protein